MILNKLKNLKWNTIALRASYIFWILFIISAYLHICVLPNFDDFKSAEAIKDICYTTDRLFVYIECVGVYDWFIVETLLNVYSIAMVPPYLFLLIYLVSFNIKTIYRRFSH